MKAKVSQVEAASLTDKVTSINGVQVLYAAVQGVDMENLRNMVDGLKTKLGSAVVVLGSTQEDKVNLVAGVTKDLVTKGYHAGKLIKEVATRCGGSGGGRPDMAQAGGKNPAELQKALQFVEEWAQKQ